MRVTPRRFMASRRVDMESRKEPRTAEGTVTAPGLRTPRMLMPRCSALTTPRAPPAAPPPPDQGRRGVGGRPLRDRGPPGQPVSQPSQLGQPGDPPLLV